MTIFEETNIVRGKIIYKEKTISKSELPKKRNNFQRNFLKTNTHHLNKEVAGTMAGTSAQMPLKLNTPSNNLI